MSGFDEMLDRFLLGLAMALFSYLEKRLERGSTALDSVPDRARLRRGGARIREWLRKQDGPSQREQSDQGRT
jgi:hypothetical protein